MYELNRPFRKPEFIFQNLDNELVLFNTESLNVLYLNESASVIWQLCDGKLTIGEMVTLLSEAYPEAAGTIASDIEETIKLFLDNHALVLL
jgi:hypothetical protein